MSRWTQRCFRTWLEGLSWAEGHTGLPSCKCKKGRWRLITRPHEYLLSDTDSEAERMLIELARVMPAWRKCEQIESAIRTGRELAMAGLRDRYPQAGKNELRSRLAALVLDRDIVMQVYGWDPEVEGY